MAMTVSGRFGRKPATRSPGPTPNAASPAAAAATSRRSWRRLSLRRRPPSFQKTRASPPPSCRSRFSAKLSRAPVNHRGPSAGTGGAIRSRPTTTSSHGARPGRSSATTPQNRHTSGQNASGQATDHSYSEATSHTCSAPAGCTCRTCARKRVMFARATRSGLGVQIGASGLCSAGMVVGLGYGFTTEARRSRRKAGGTAHPIVLAVLRDSPCPPCLRGENETPPILGAPPHAPRALTTSAD